MPAALPATKTFPYLRHSGSRSRVASRETFWENDNFPSRFNVTDIQYLLFFSYESCSANPKLLLVPKTSKPWGPNSQLTLTDEPAPAVMPSLPNHPPAEFPGFRRPSR